MSSIRVVSLAKAQCAAHHAFPAGAPAFGVARAGWVSADLFLAETDITTATEATSGIGRQPEIWAGGDRVQPPLCSFPTARGLLLLARIPTARARGLPITLRRAGLVSLCRTDSLGPLLLLADRSTTEAERLLRFLLSGAMVTLRAAREPAFLALVHAFGLRLAMPGAVRLTHDATPWAVWSLPAEATLGSAPVWLLTADGSKRLPPRLGRLALLPDAVPPNAVLLPPDGPPLGLGIPTGATPGCLPSIASLARGPERRPLLALLAAAAAADPTLAPLLRETQLFAPARATALTDPGLPVGGALELALPDGAGGVFLRGWLRDPIGLVSGLALFGPDERARPIPPAALFRTPRPDLSARLAAAPQGDGGSRPGFVTHLANAATPGTAQCGLLIQLQSGATLRLMAPPGVLPPGRARDLVLGSVVPDAASPTLMDSCLSPAAARFHQAALALPGQPERLEFGPAAARARQPMATVVVPLWRTLSYLRPQITAFARDPALRRCEIVFVLDSPEDRLEAERQLRGLATLHALRMSLLVTPRNLGYGPACNLGAAAGTAPLVMLLNSDVVPVRPGWLERLRARLGRDPALVAVAPKLIYGDGAIQHAGLYFSLAEDDVWSNGHAWKGWPRGHPAACRARRVPAASGAALCLRRAAFDAVGGFSPDYILGDYEDSDLCLALRAKGGEIGYEPTAELIHDERQSIAGHPGHARSLAAAHNRRLHHRRWGPTLAALANRFPVPFPVMRR